jgi:hypothetical protein
MTMAPEHVPGAAPRASEAVRTAFDTHYAWDYGSRSEGLRGLYDKAKAEQWNAHQLPWETEVDPESEIIPAAFNPLQDYPPFKKLSPRELGRFRHAQIAWQLSQFMHGEQGALIVASQLVGVVPWLDAKLYAATQTVDEARHVEVFSRYLHEKLEWEFPINPNLRKLLDLIVQDDRWDMKYLGMQILVEGLAMAAFANLYTMAAEPLAKSLVHYVMRDESRHVAFGVISLKGTYDEMSAAERREREEFVVEACALMRDRLVGEEISDVVGFDRDEVRELVLGSEFMRLFRSQLFSRVVPNVKRLGLLSEGVRHSFEQLEILGFEDSDPEAQDRALGITDVA